jgi:predicted nucleic acid-binding protein
MNAKPFLDTNVVLYAFREGDSRAQKAEDLLARGGLISVQVLNEFAAVARRKLTKSWGEVRRALGILRVFCPEPVPLTVKTHEAALQIAERYKYSVYDGLILAAALESGCNVVYSEDLQDGQVIENSLTIQNPFKIRTA